MENTQPKEPSEIVVPEAPPKRRRSRALAVTPAMMLQTAVEQGADLAPAITPMQMLNWFSYDPDTGVISWKKKPNRNIPVGRAAGFEFVTDYTTYIRIMLNGRAVFAHVVAFVCMTGRRPVGEVDHVSGDGTDNRWSNLRDVTHAENLRNQRLNARNKSGVMGVDFHCAARKWRARIIVDKHEHHLGTFASRGEAIAARKIAEVRFGFHENHGRS